MVALLITVARETKGEGRGGRKTVSMGPYGRPDSHGGPPIPHASFNFGGPLLYSKKRRTDYSSTSVYE